MSTTQTPTSRKTCKRCHGTGEYRGYGKCYGCYGHGVIIPAEIPAPVDPEYLEGLAARERRAAERRARMATR